MKTNILISEKNKLTRIIAAYSVLWLVCAGLIYLIFRANGKLFLWDGDSEDGVYQHFIAFDYLCRYLRSLLIDHRPMGFFNFTLGQGTDVLTTLTAYGFTDPLNILAALLFPLSRLSRFTLTIFLRLYLVGLSFIVYCRASEKNNLSAVLCGAIAYTFSGVILFTFARHPCHINWAYFFPFLLSGVELYNRQGRRIPLILAVFLNLVTSYYTFYMNAVLTVLYILVAGLCRLFLESPRSTWQQELQKGLRIAALFVIGILLSSFVLLPTAYAFLNNPRVMTATGYTASGWHYGLQYYSDLVEALFEPHFSPGYYTRIGFNAVVFLPLALLFTKKGHARLKALLLLSLFMLCLPLAGRIMNGMSYTTNRWSYAAVFYGSFALVELYDELKGLSVPDRCRLSIIAASFILIILFIIKTYFKNNAVFTVLVLGWTVLVFILVQIYKNAEIARLFVFLTLVGAVFQIYFTFSRNAAYYTGEFLDYDRMPSCYTDFSSTAAAGLDSRFYRVEEAEGQPNKDGFNNVNGTALWWSMLPSEYLEYLNGLNLNTIRASTMFYGLDGRTGLLELAGVKYYTRPASETGQVPYGFEEIESPQGAYQLFENRNALPIGYTYCRYITRSEYEAMIGPEREQALLQAAVLEDEDAPERYDKADMQLDVTDLDYRITETENVILSENRLAVKDALGTVSFSVTVPEDCELFLYLKGIRLLNPAGHVWIDISSTAEDYFVSKQANILNPQYTWAFPREAVAINLGYGHAGENRIVLTVSQEAEFELESIRLLAVPMSLYREYASERRESVMEDVDVGRDRITGRISVPDRRILQFSVPYSSGWKAYIDGKETSLVKSDVLYMAAFVDEGTHEITLRYSTPWLLPGCMLSVVTFVLFCAWEIVTRRRARFLSACQS